jgi:hypothetical protein
VALVAPPPGAAPPASGLGTAARAPTVAGHGGALASGTGQVAALSAVPNAPPRAPQMPAVPNLAAGASGLGSLPWIWIGSGVAAAVAAVIYFLVG